MARILLCRTCKTADVVPDYKGPMISVPVQDRWPVKPEGKRVGDLVEVEAADALMEEAVSKHLMVQGHSTVIVPIPDDHVPAFLNGARQVEIDAKDLDSNLRNDAGVCFNKHLRPEGGCPDWCSEEKVVGSTSMPPERRSYLCYWCPVSAHVYTKLREKKGYYS